MYEYPRRSRQARNFTTIVPKILDLKSSSEQIFFRKLSLGAPVQYILNAAAKVITCKRKFDHVTPLLIELHWLPVRQRIVFKILLYTFKALHGATLTYLTELISPYVPRRALRSADQLLLEQPTHKLNLIDLSFPVCAPYL